MFTWICPKCGREVPPAYDECPDCALKEKQGRMAPAGQPVEPVPPVAPPPPPPPMPQWVPPPVPAAAYPPPPPPPPPPYAVPQATPRGVGIPTWLLSLLFALAFVGLFGGVYWLVNALRDHGQSNPQAAQTMPIENPSRNKGKPHPMQKYIEVSGVRFIQNAKKATEARFLVVNHSADDISDLGGVVTIWGRTQKSDEEAVGSFSFKLPSIGPWESKEMAAPMNTKLRVYELPDWQNITAEVQLTSP